MSAINRLGFVLKDKQGQVQHDSSVSALSKRPTFPGCPLCAVPGASGLFVRLLPREDRQITDDLRADLYRQAVAWREEVAPVEQVTRSAYHRKQTVVLPPAEPAELPTEVEE